MADELADMKVATAAVHIPGPKRMVGRQIIGHTCLGCGDPWPCQHSWQARAEAAEAVVAAIRSVLLEGSQPDAMARKRALAIIISSEEKA